jgi:hypothetical protein
VNFETDIIPVLTKSGCNTGACHGAAVGRGGFRLSLYGGDPRADYQSIVLELEGRRVNLTHPDESLVLLKPTETVEHGGGSRLDPDGAGVRLLQTWIQQGATYVQNRRLSHVEVSPQAYVTGHVGEAIQLSATASFSDGSTRDVTKWTVFTPEDPSAVGVDADTTMATVLRRGRHIVVARYLDQVAPLEIILPFSDAPVDLSHEPRQNFIDHYVIELLSTLRLPVSHEADDATFLRRVTLDLTGRLPTPELIDEFVGKQDEAKREQLVDRLLGSEQFNQYWTLQLAKLLRVRSQPNDFQGALTYHRWLNRQVAAGTGYDELARQLLLASGDTHENGPANFYRTVAGPREQAEFMSELFMGNRLRCANCHNHPLDRWTQDDYHGLAAIFAKIESGRVVTVQPGGQVTHPRTGENAVPRIPGESFLESGVDPREALARWLTKERNPYFAKAIVNRLWKAMMGRGLVEPADDLRATNPATHPRLLDELARDFVEHGFDLRHTLRRIALSSTYARSADVLPGNAIDDRYYSHALREPLEPEVLADAISDVLGVPDQYGDQPFGTRAVALFDSNIESETLDILGRCSREQTCEGSAETTGGLPRKLHLLNGPLLNRRIAAPEGRLTRLVATGTPPLKIIDEFYLCALGRRASPQERAFWNEQMQDDVASGEQLDVLEDFVWSLLTCSEFVTNH